MSTTHKPTLVTFRVFLIQCTLAGLYRVQQIQISNIRLQTSPTLLGQKTSVGNWNIMPWTFTSDGMLLHTIFPAYLQCQTPHFSWEPKISGPNNVWPHTFRARLQYQAPTMSDPTLIVRDYNIRPQNPTLFVRDYNIRPRQCQTPHFSFETTISGSNNVRPHAFRARIQYQAPTMSDLKLFVRDYNNIRLLITLGDTFECHFLGNTSAEQFYKPTYQPFWGTYLLNNMKNMTYIRFFS